MPIRDIYSKRQKRSRGETADVFEYGKIPQQLRIQAIHIWRDGIPAEGSLPSQRPFEYLHNALCREYGTFFLVSETYLRSWGYAKAFEQFLVDCEDEQALDAIELVFQYIDTVVREQYRVGLVSTESFSRNAQLIKAAPATSVEELNSRFLEAGVGYQFESGQLIRVDSKFLHAEVVKPALELLSDTKYSGANCEFLKAHEHYRHKNYKEALVECLKTVESVLKIIFDDHGWAYKDTDSVKRLIDIAFDNKLVPDYLQSQFSALRSLLESGVPTARNRAGGHGQGSKIIAAPEHLAGYILGSTAAVVVFLVESAETIR